MVSIIDLHKNSTENEEQYIWRLCQAKDSGVLDMAWDTLAAIFNSELRKDDEDFSPAAYRKPYQNAKRYWEAGVFNQYNNNSNKYFSELEEKRRQLEQEKIKFRDERNAWNKQNYIAARATQKLDYLEECLKNIGKINFDPVQPSCQSMVSTNDMLVILSDLHIGQCFSSYWGEYNSDIAKQRLNEYLNQILYFQSIYNSENCYISLQGDLISNSIHKTIAISNRENVIQQIKLVSEYIASFCYELSKTFKKVYIYDVSGNHSRIDKKEEAMHDERLDSLISWIVKNMLSHIENVIVPENSYFDIGICGFDIRGKKYISVHGDYDPFSKNGVQNLSSMLGFFPYAILYGHLHTNAYMEYNGVNMIRGGSLAGSGDDYTIEKRLNGKPSQMICICGEHGFISLNPIKFKK